MQVLAQRPAVSPFSAAPLRTAAIVPAGTKLAFAGKPKVRRTRNESSLRLAEYVAIDALVLARDTEGRPLANAPITFSARSVAFQSARARTDHRGHASAFLAFPVPPGSLRIEMRACLTEDSSVCTPIVQASLRDWIDLDLSFDMGITAAPLPKDIRSYNFQLVNTDYTIFGAGTAKLRLNLWEREEKWKYYRFSVYGSVPALAKDRGVGFSLGLSPYTPNYQSVDGTAGLGDVSGGVEMVLRGIAFADVSYNGLSGKVNEIESIRRFTAPRLVSLGDGMESIDSNLELRKFVGERGPFFFGRVSNYHPLPRRFSSLRTVEREDAYQFSGGIGLLQGADSAFLVLGGYQQWGATRLIDRGRVTRYPGGDGYFFGLARAPLSRKRVMPSANFIVGGLGTGRVFVAAGATLAFALF
jgi:hypothetical protein